MSRTRLSYYPCAINKCSPACNVQNPPDPSISTTTTARTTAEPHSFRGRASWLIDRYSSMSVSGCSKRISNILVSSAPTSTRLSHTVSSCLRFQTTTHRRVIRFPFLSRPYREIRLQPSQHDADSNRMVARQIYRLGHTRRWQDALQLYQSVTSPDAEIVVAIINTSIITGRPELGIKLFYDILADYNPGDDGDAQARETEETGMDISPPASISAGAAAGAANSSSDIIVCSKQSTRSSQNMNSPPPPHRHVMVWNVAISAHGKLVPSRFHEACDLLFHKMPHYGVSPSPDSYTAVMKTFPRNDPRSWKYALALLQMMKRKRVVPGVVTYFAAILTCKSEGKHKVAAYLLRQMQQQGLELNDYVYNAAIIACTKEANWKWAMQLLDEMQQNGIKPSIDTCTSCINVLAEGGQLKQALKLFQNMINCDMEPDVLAYTTIIRAAIHAGEPEIARRLLHLMRQQGITANLKAYNRWISSCEKYRDWKTAFFLFDDLSRAAAHKPDVFTYNAAISVCHKCGPGFAHKAWILFNEMINAGIQPQIMTYTALISACDNDRHWDPALCLLQDMKDRGLTPNITIYVSLMTACTNGGKYMTAIKLFQEFRQNPRFKQEAKGKEGLAFYTAAMIALNGEDLGYITLKILDEMKHSGIKPDIVAYNAAIIACSREGFFGDYSLYDIVSSDRNSASDDVDHDIRTRSVRALELLRELEQEARLKANPITYWACMKAFVRGEEYQHVVDLYERFRATRMTPYLPESFYELIITACEKLGDQDKELEARARLAEYDESVIMAFEQLRTTRKDMETFTRLKEKQPVDTTEEVEHKKTKPHTIIR